MPEELQITPPISPAEMNRLRLDFRRTLPNAGFGAHIHRRMGQSLEFREYGDYHLGDDIRKVDWLASMRTGLRRDWIVRSFEAEERRALMIVLDCRPAMYLPEAANKLRIACWVAQCLASAAFCERDRVIFGTLFAPKEFSVINVEGRRGLDIVIAYCQRLVTRPIPKTEWEAEPWTETIELVQRMQPASAIVLISDMTFADSGNRLIRFAQAAQKSYRTLSVIEIDSWPVERALLSDRPFRLGTLEGRAFGDDLREVDVQIVRETEARIRAHHASLRRAWSGPGLIWPQKPFRLPEIAQPSVAQINEWFRREFARAPFLHGLLSRAAA